MSVNWPACGRAWVRANLGSPAYHIPLFDEVRLVVRLDTRLNPGVLRRSSEVDTALATITDIVVAGFGDGVEGMLYCLYTLENDLPVPLYVGIANAAGHTGRLSSLFRNSRKKPRFDDYDGYHIGDLSTQVVPGYAKKKAYKEKWAQRMFSNAPSVKPKLRTPVFFWGKAWSVTDISVLRVLGHTSLCLEERVLIESLEAAYPCQRKEDGTPRRPHDGILSRNPVRR